MKEHSLEYLKRYVEAALEGLKDYLLSDDLFWPMDAHAPLGEGAYPALTLGNTLLFLAMLRARWASPDVEEQVRALEERLHAIHTRWPTAWERKASREWRSRLRQWGRFVEELRSDAREHAAYYAYEVRLRVILDLLAENGARVDRDDEDALRTLDARLKERWRRGGVLWPRQLMSGFPEERFWYLWGEVSG